MPFYRMPDGRGTVHMNFGRKHGPSPCRASRLAGDDPRLGTNCGRMSVALCDAIIGQDLGGKDLTCDMPLCDHHRTRGGQSIDFCPRHVHLAFAELPLGRTTA